MSHDVHELAKAVSQLSPSCFKLQRASRHFWASATVHAEEPPVVKQINPRSAGMPWRTRSNKFVSCICLYDLALCHPACSFPCGCSLALAPRGFGHPRRIAHLLIRHDNQLFILFLGNLHNIYAARAFPFNPSRDIQTDRLNPGMILSRWARAQRTFDPQAIATSASPCAAARSAGRRPDEQAGSDGHKLESTFGQV